MEKSSGRSSASDRSATSEASVLSKSFSKKAYHACWFAHESLTFRDEVYSYFSSVERSGARLLILCNAEKSTYYSQLLSEKKFSLENIEIAPVDEVLGSDGAIDPEEFIERLREVRREALDDGSAHLHIFFDMEWVAGQRSCVHQIASLCTRIDTFLLEQDASVLAYFERSIFSPTRLLDLLPLYPQVYARGQILESNYYAAAEDRLKRHRHQAILDHVLSTLKGFDSNDQHYSGPPVDAESTLLLLRTIIDSMGDGVIVVDDQGRLILFNKAGKSIIGYDFTELSLEERVRKFGNFLPDKVTPFPIEELPVARALRGEATDQTEIFIRNEKKPGGLWVSTSARPLIDREGRIRGGVVVFRDISERREEATKRAELEAQILQKQKLESLGLLAGGIAHDFNNLLVGILANASIALETPRKAEVRECLADIKMTAERLRELTGQLLDYSGKKQSRVESCEVNGMVEELRSMLRPVISSKAKLRCGFDRKKLFAEFDPTQIRQVVMNLLTNASDSLAGDEGTIDVETGREWLSAEALENTFLGGDLKEGEFAYISVKDSGVGFERDTLERIFDPFYTTKSQGRGLGLAAVLGLVKANSGALQVESNPRPGPDRGSSFTLYLPLAEANSLPESNPKVSNSKFVGRVLIVDDEEIVRRAASRVLEHSGYSVITASSGKEGLEKFRADPLSIDAIVLDLTMPDMSGQEVYKNLRQFSPQAKVLISSGFSQLGLRLPGEGNSAHTGFLQKPYLPERLLEKLRELTG